MKKIIAFVLVAATIFTLFTGCKKTNEKADDTVYSVLQVTDVHILNDEKKDAKVLKTVRLMVEKAKPDMVIVTGDITSEKVNMPAIKTFSEFMEKLNLPWAFTFGNHDAEGDTSKQEISDYLETLENCIYERGDPAVSGMGNYYYNVMGKDDKPLMSLIMMDSNMYPEDKSLEGYDNFHEDQIQWYERTVKSIATAANGDETKVVPSLAFFHIPMQEYTIGYDEAKKNKSILSGRRFETECSSHQADEMFETMLRLGSTKGTFVGHDHMNDYSVEYKGIRLTYANSGDHNIYVVPLRGGTLINIKEDGTFKTQKIYRHRFSNNITIKSEK